MDTGLGASTWASGSQPCSGKTGILTPKPMNRPAKISNCMLSGKPRPPAAMSAIAKLWPGAASYRKSSATSMNTEPPKVYRKKLSAAFCRFGPPRRSIRKNSGSSVASQNT